MADSHLHVGWLGTCSYLPLLFEWGKHGLGVVYSGEEILSRLLVYPVEIHSCQWCPWVTNDNTIRIQHRNQFEHKVRPQNLHRFEKLVSLLNTTCRATLAWGASEVSQLISPSITQLLLLSPGWTRAVTTMPLRLANVDWSAQHIVRCSHDSQCTRDDPYQSNYHYNIYQSLYM